MKIFAVGCSFTYGHELSDPVSQSWVAKLSEKLEITIDNHAVPGGTNQRTVYQTVKHLKDYDAFIIAWTDFSRYTYYQSDSAAEININPQLKNDMLKVIPGGRIFGDLLYKNFHNRLVAFKLWLQQIIMLQSLMLGRRYLMVNTMPNDISLLRSYDDFRQTAKDWGLFDRMNDAQLFDSYDEIVYYHSLIDTSKFFRWQDFYITSLNKLYPCGPGGHFLEAGHEAMSNLILEHVQNKITNC